jgi:hypothetical protein
VAGALTKCNWCAHAVEGLGTLGGFCPGTSGSKVACTSATAPPSLLYPVQRTVPAYLAHSAQRALLDPLSLAKSQSC